MVCTACVVYPWSNNINPDMDMATPGALGTRMVRIRIIAHRDLRGCKFVAYYCMVPNSKLCTKNTVDLEACYMSQVWCVFFIWAGLAVFFS